MLSSVVSAELLEGEVRRRGLTSIAAVTTIHDGMLAFKDSFIARLATPPIADVQVESGESDFKAIALSLHRKRPAGIFIGLLPPQAALFARAIRALGYKGELFASNQIDMPSELVAGGKAFDGLWFSRDGAKRDPWFLTRYQERYKGVPATFALNGYDVGVMIRTGSKEGDLVQYLTNLTHFKGALGTYSAKSDRTFSIPGSLWTLSDGVARIMEE
jgi:ABC-type branched-subunit amino acid transport system substrate-binding protein